MRSPRSCAGKDSYKDSHFTGCRFKTYSDNSRAESSAFKKSEEAFTGWDVGLVMLLPWCRPLRHRPFVTTLAPSSPKQLQTADFGDSARLDSCISIPPFGQSIAKIVAYAITSQGAFLSLLSQLFDSPPVPANNAA
jgi:hypothetical protein